MKKKVLSVVVVLILVLPSFSTFPPSVRAERTIIVPDNYPLMQPWENYSVMGRVENYFVSKLTYVEGWPHARALSSEFASVSSVPHETLIDEPRYNSSKPLYGTYQLGNGNDTQITFVIDESNGTGTGYDIVYVDSNNNENLTDDGGPHKKVPWATGLAFYVTVTVDYDINGHHVTGPYRMWTYFQENYSRMGYYTNCYYEGLITIDGKSYNVYVYDYDADGIYNDFGVHRPGHKLYIDLNRDGDFEDANEGYYQMGDTFILNNLTYRIQYISPKGDIIQIQRIINQPPVAFFTYSPSSPAVNQPITFDASQSYDPDGTITRYQWDFGDGSTGSGVTVKHTYSKPGSYTVTLTVMDNDGAKSSTSKTVQVTTISAPLDFSILVSPISSTIQQGSSGFSVITIVSINGFDQAVQLSVSGIPSGVTATLNPQVVTPPAGDAATSTLTVSVDKTVMPGTYTLTVTGISGSLAHSVDISLEITAAPIISSREAKMLAEIAKTQAMYFGSISNFLKTRTDPEKYLKGMAEEWEKLGEELSPKPEKAPLEFLLKIFKADEVKTMGDLCKGLIAPFKSLSEVTFWSEFWKSEELKGHIQAITDKLDKLSSLYSEESEYWNKIAEGRGNIDELLKIISEEKQAIEELKKALNDHIPKILDEFKESPYKPLTIAEEGVNEGDVHEYFFELRRQPKFIEVKVAQEHTAAWWEFWKTKPRYRIELFYGPPLTHGWDKKIYTPAGQPLETLETEGTTLKIGTEWQGFLSHIAEAIINHHYEKFKLRITCEDLGGDNLFTWWNDEGIKNDHIKIVVRYGPEKETYKDTYPYQAKSLEDFWKYLVNYLDYSQSTMERLIDTLKK